VSIHLLLFSIFPKERKREREKGRGGQGRQGGREGGTCSATTGTVPLAMKSDLSWREGGRGGRGEGGKGLEKEEEEGRGREGGTDLLVEGEGPYAEGELVQQLGVPVASLGAEGGREVGQKTKRRMKEGGRVGGREKVG